MVEAGWEPKFLLHRVSGQGRGQGEEEGYLSLSLGPRGS